MRCVIHDISIAPLQVHY